MPPIVIYADRYWKLTPEGVVVSCAEGEPEQRVEVPVLPPPVARALGLATA